jgi:hypothetical protein
LPANLGRDVSVLQQDGALKILAAVQPGTQNEMTIEQRAGFAKKGEKVFWHSFVCSGAL